MNKLRYIGGIICNSSAVDQKTQSLSAFNVIDEITVDLKANDPSKVNKNSIEKINIPINFQVISVWKRNNLSDSDKATDTKLEVEFLDPIGNSLAKSIIEMHLPADKKRNRYILNVNGMQITITGEYQIQFREIMKNGERSEILNTFYLDVIINKS